MEGIENTNNPDSNDNVNDLSFTLRDIQQQMQRFDKTLQMITSWKGEIEAREGSDDDRVSR